MADTSIKRAERLAKKHGLDEAGQVKILRCVAALEIFEEGHPEFVEVVGLLKSDPNLFSAVNDFVEEANHPAK